MKEFEFAHYKVIEVDGQPYGRFVNPFPQYIDRGRLDKISKVNPEWQQFKDYANQNQRPFPGATIGDVIEADKVDTITLDAKDARLLSQAIGFDHKLMPLTGEFTYYAMKQQPVSEATWICEYCGNEHATQELEIECCDVLREEDEDSRLFNQPVSEEPEETALEAAERVASTCPFFRRCL